jgi:DNA-binding NarL/FixJ family response regulator
VLDHRGDLESVTTAALRWIEELGDPGSGQSLPMVVRAVAAQARHAGDDHPHAPVSARSRAATRSGRWLVVHAMRMHGAETGRIAVIIEPADPREAAPLIVAAYGLSDRERAVTQLVLQGAATGEIAQRLHISPLTVQDHLKQIFDKTGVQPAPSGHQGLLRPLLAGRSAAAGRLTGRGTGRAADPRGSRR